MDEFREAKEVKDMCEMDEVYEVTDDRNRRAEEQRGNESRQLTG